ncbi:unnamed protein product [Acanthoscelides obtectus]|nr:unnamed protein product [Acanthoscelides obtectus]CAK1626900.1 Phospholipase A-2-activating protein [Acanthoscelides obtectus]
MIRENGGVMAYSWVEEGDTGHWEKIGDVMGGVENKEGEKKKYEGKEYDFVFSVDVEDGKPPLKLPFNKGDDPYVAAHAFLEKHFLPADYLEQVVDFILKNSNEQYVPKLTAEYQDPFTGSSRHTPSYGQNQGQTAALDPFTGANAYTTSKPSEAASNSLSSNSNSLNQGSRSSGFFPQTSYRSFDMGDPGVILNKLKEFNQKCGDGSQRVDDRQLEEMVKVANGLPSDPNAFDTLFKLLDWPDDIIFPVLDVVRLAVKHKKNNEVIVSMNNGIIVEKLKHYTNGCCKVTSNIIVSLRTLSNLCLHEPGELLVYNNRFELFENFTSLSELTKAGQVALATCLLNVTIMTGKQKDELGFSVLAQVLPDILSRLTDPEAQFRLYVAVGTLIKTAQLHGAAVKAKLNENSNFLSTMQSHSFSGQNELENKRMNCVKQLSALL